MIRWRSAGCALGLIGLAVLPSAAGMVLMVARVFDARLTPAAGLWVTSLRLLGAVVTSAWLVSAVVMQPPDPPMGPGRRAQRALVAIALGVVTIVTSLPAAKAGAFGSAIYGCTLALLALTACASHGVHLDMSLDVRSSAGRASAWRQTVATVGACVAGGVLTTIGTALISRLGAGGAVPVMKGDQLTALGIGSLGTLLLLVVFAVTIEDIVIVAAGTRFMEAARWLSWLIYTVICTVEVLIHAYLGLPALGMAVYAACRVAIFRRHGRVLPLILGHGLFDIAGALLMPLPTTARAVALLPIGVGGAVLDHFLTRAGTTAQAVAAPTKEPS